MERLSKSVGDCVRNGITMEEFKEYVLPKVPEEFMEVLRTGKLDADDLTELSKFLGKLEITRRLETEELQSYLRRLLPLLLEPVPTA